MQNWNDDIFSKLSYIKHESPYKKARLKYNLIRMRCNQMRNGMDLKKAKYIYGEITKPSKRYDEERHCIMALNLISETGRISSFCTEALICEDTFYTWVNKYPIFRQSYRVAQMFAQEKWEAEPEENLDNPEWDQKAWQARGSRYFAKNTGKIRLHVTPGATPWEQYQEVIEQAQLGDFTGAEVKQIMETINIGVRVYESYKLQGEVDKMREDLALMSSRHGDNIIPITKAAQEHQTAVDDKVRGQKD
jgi:hypothetical protein